MTKLEEALMARGNPGVAHRFLIAEGDNQHRTMWPTTHEAHPGYTVDDQLAAGRRLQAALQLARTSLWPRDHVGEVGSMIAEIDAALAAAAKAGVK